MLSQIAQAGEGCDVTAPIASTPVLTERGVRLLLTATPVQDNLEKLHNPVTLKHPGLLSTSRQFARQFIARHVKLAPRNLDQLHGLLAEAMVRNRRSNVSAGLTRRCAQTLGPRIPATLAR